MLQRSTAQSPQSACHSSDDSRERGAILVYVALALVAFTVFSAIVVDYGTFWVARSQAQNAADAGALAGTIARLYDDSTSPHPTSTSSGAVYENVVSAVAGNPVWGQAPPADTLAIDWTCPDGTTSCVSVDVYRDGTHNSRALPTFFMRFVGVSTQGTKAHAVGQTVPANAVDCIKPWMAPDKGTGVSYGLSDVGMLLVLRASGAPSQFQQAKLDKSGAINCHGGGAACYADAQEHCVNGPEEGGTWAIGDPIVTKNGEARGKQEADYIYAQDSGATWDLATDSIANSCAPHGCGCTDSKNPCNNGQNGTISPRIIDLAAFDPTALLNLPSGEKSLPIQNFISVFLLPPGVGDPRNPANAPCVADPDNVCGYLIASQGKMIGGVTTPSQSTNVAILLIR
jgi:hypothetical protein